MLSPEERLQELEAYNATLRQRIQAMQAELTKLRAAQKTAHPVDASLHEELANLQAENEQLREQNSKLREEVQSASKSVNIAWQQGYLAGQHAAASEMQQEQKSFIDSLAEAAQAATAYGGEGGGAATATAAPPATTLHDEPQAPPVYEEPSYIAEALDLDTSPLEYAEETPAETEEVNVAEALNLSDPEVLNDPFTAKLLDALGVDLESTVTDGDGLTAAIIEPPPPHEPQSDTNPNLRAQRALDFEDVSVDHFDAESTAEINPAPAYGPIEEFEAAPDVTLAEAEEGPTAEQPLPEEPAATEASEAGESGEDDPEKKTNFTADELHNLFRNKYVREDDPTEGRDPAASGTFPSFKKFVGTNKSASDPLPVVQRAFPPEIRKACKLLGLNPEEITRPIVTDAWKKEMAKPGVHPDTGGDTEMAIYLNTAKDTLMRWIDDQTPKLGKKFGSAASTREHQKPKTQE